MIAGNYLRLAATADDFSQSATDLLVNELTAVCPLLRPEAHSVLAGKDARALAQEMLAMSREEFSAAFKARR